MKREEKSSIIQLKDNVVKYQNEKNEETRREHLWKKCN
jgi:hypothetical protein